MGADVYLNSLYEKTRDYYQPLFDEAVRKRDTLMLKLNDGRPTNENFNHPEVKKLQEKVSEYYNLMNSEGYFRDSYNATSLLWVLGLSWWSDVGDMLNKKGELSITKTKKFWKMIKDRPVTIEAVQKAMGEHQLQDTADEWFEYWVEKRQRLIELLELSIELKEPLIFSV